MPQPSIDPALLRALMQYMAAPQPSQGAPTPTSMQWAPPSYPSTNSEWAPPTAGYSPASYSSGGFPSGQQPSLEEQINSGEDQDLNAGIPSGPRKSIEQQIDEDDEDKR